MPHPFRYTEDSTNAYFYNIDSEFNIPRQDIALFCLDWEIGQAGLGSIYKYAYMDSEDPDIGFLFTRPLTAEEETTLDNVVDAHYGDCPPKPQEHDFLIYDSTTETWIDQQYTPAIKIHNEGVPVEGTPHKILDFTGIPINAQNMGNGRVKVFAANPAHRLQEHTDIPTPQETDVTIVYDGTSYIWFPHLVPGDSVITGISFTMSDHASHDYVGTGTTSYTNIRSFVYDGTEIWTPEHFLVIASLSRAGATGLARLYDHTHNNVIAIVSWTNLDKQIVSTTTLSNLPLSDSIIELQVATDTNGTDARVHYMALY